MNKKIVISCALCGAGTTREQTPHVPITPDEIAADAVACGKAGASVIHIHARDLQGKNTMDTETWIEVVSKVRSAASAAGVDIVLNLTTSGSAFSEDLRCGHLPLLKPEMCSYDPGTMNWANSYVFLNTPKFLERLGTLTQELQIKPEIEIFDAGMIGNVEFYLKKGFLQLPLHYQLVLDVPGGMPGTLESLAYLTSKFQPGCTWSITGIGKAHLSMMLAGLAAGADGLRVGLEDNIFLEKGVLATNVQLVERAVALSKMAGREIATAEEARRILGLVKHV
ncbi:3-keto-5-aminohexanoate cleavage protein [Oleispirillum naphthae]|uniref:3-keto-5-aminohexanoate cleavage protein n=1 Tax=Oleispirillum naphthae TaxID=2838853 RepID=UPI003082542B